MATKRKLDSVSVPEEPSPDPSDEFSFVALGGGNEVGRSCHIIQYKGRTIMLDAGTHPGKNGMDALPFFDEFDLETVDLLLISHFHVDHAGGLPYVLAKTSFKGRVFMTHSTKAIYKWLLQDNLRVNNTTNIADNTTELYTEKDHWDTFGQIETIDYHTTHNISGVRITPLPAGHVLGAAMYIIEIGGCKILFTGDYSREEDRHLIPAEVPKNVKIDVLITESTFGISSAEPRLERETALMKSVTKILDQGGRALLPVFALGRAQEVLLILDEFWEKHPKYQKIPIYYTSSLARKCMSVYQTYISAMNDNIKRKFQESMEQSQGGGQAVPGPWDFKFVRSLKSLDKFKDIGSSVMLAAPGMLQNGTSRELLERWAPDSRNGVVITGYSVEGTMARRIMNEPEYIESIAAKSYGQTGKQEGMIPRRCSVEEISFAAHVSGVENEAFIKQISAPHVILVHGERRNMSRLKSKLIHDEKSKPDHLKTQVYSPLNTEEITFYVRTDKVCTFVGELAERTKHLPKLLGDADPEVRKTAEEDPSRIIRNAVIVRDGDKFQCMTPRDIPKYTGLPIATVTCKYRITLSSAGLELIRWALEGAFGGIEVLDPYTGMDLHEVNGFKPSAKQEDAEDKSESWEYRLRVMEAVDIFYKNRGEMLVEWEGNTMNDTIADSVLMVLYSVESSPAAVKHSSQLHLHTQVNGAPTGNSDPRKAARTKSLPNPSPSPQAHNPHTATDPSTSLQRFLWFMETQFGVDDIEPILGPHSSSAEHGVNGLHPQDDKTIAIANSLGSSEWMAPPIPSEYAEKLGTKDGVHVPGLRIKCDNHSATVWLDTLEVEGTNKNITDRVRAVVGRAMECIEPLWRM